VSLHLKERITALKTITCHVTRNGAGSLGLCPRTPVKHSQVRAVYVREERRPDARSNRPYTDPWSRRQSAAKQEVRRSVPVLRSLPALPASEPGSDRPRRRRSSVLVADSRTRTGRQAAQCPPPIPEACGSGREMITRTAFRNRSSFSCGGPGSPTHTIWRRACSSRELYEVA